MRFKDKSVLITGSSTGIGRVTAFEFAKAGACVIVNCIKSENKAMDVAKKINKLGKKAIFIKCDVSDENQVKMMFKQIIETFGKIDIVVNNAGFAKQNNFFDLSVSDFKRTLDVNLIGTFLCSKHAAKEMIKMKNGKIINISSIRGINNCARKDLIDYSAAKAGVINMTKALAKELTPFGINVNAIAPGITRTELVKNLSEDARNKAIDGSIIKRMAEPMEIAKAILFLASEDANYITGEVLVIDGGYNLTKL